MIFLANPQIFWIFSLRAADSKQIDIYVLTIDSQLE